MTFDEHPLVGSDAARAMRTPQVAVDTVVVGMPNDQGRRTDPSGTSPLAAYGGSLFSGQGPGLGGLASAAECAEGAERLPLVVVAADLDVSPVALLDLLDGPMNVTAILTIGRDVLDVEPKQLAPLRVDPYARVLHSVGTARHLVTNPTSYAVGVLRIRAADRARAAEIWRAAAETVSAHDRAVSLFDLAVLALVRAGVDVTAVPLGPHTLTRGEDHARGAPGSAWQQRLRGASRGNDGAFSTAVVRPLSRRLTAFGLGHDWSPNVVTMVSLLLGLVASTMTLVDLRVTWALAAVLLQASLVVDCVDGEIARFTRCYSPIGGWLDAVSDRVKEFAIVAAVAWVAARRGEELWTLAIVLLVVLAIRHVEDYAYARRARCSHAGRGPDLLQFDIPRDLGPTGSRTTVPEPPTGRALAVHKVKQVLHLPIAERYLILSVGLLTFSPALLLWTLTAAVIVALLWTEVGRTLRAVLHRDEFDPGRPDPQLHHLLDLGLLARPLRGVAIRLARWRLGWQVPWLLLAAEGVVVLVVLRGVPQAQHWAGYAWLVAVGWRRYDLIYRLRETGRGPASWVGIATLGCLARMALLLGTAALAWPAGSILAWGALVLICLYVAESAAAWMVSSRDSHVPQTSRPADPEVTA